MSETTMLTVAGAVVAAMFGLLSAILGWLGAKLYAKVDQMTTALNAMASELHIRINGLDRRVTAVETKCEIHYNFDRREA